MSLLLIFPLIVMFRGECRGPGKVRANLMPDLAQGLLLLHAFP
ncbi:hypothetical protein HMPREF3038_01940 [Akkermansia sp. KLE1797]|nr:hypothetical protein HMPREF3038_01940 [Akkermansia sp. KLE1797]KXU54665.1 hypothetical protein HMPREF3039_01137 [Akkermansia sp. KLE1798]